MSTYAEYKGCEKFRLFCLKKLQFCRKLEKQVDHYVKNCDAKEKLRVTCNEYSEYWRGKDANAFAEKLRELYMEFGEISEEMKEAIRWEIKNYEELYQDALERQQQCERELDEAGKAQLLLYRGSDGILF